MMTPEEFKSHADFARWLIGCGYRCTSNRYRMVSRIDREDWVEEMAKRVAPWDPEGKGMRWAKLIGGEQYRRVYSKDSFEGLPIKVYTLVKKAGNDLDVYLPKLPLPQKELVKC